MDLFSDFPLIEIALSSTLESEKVFNSSLLNVYEQHIVKWRDNKVE